MTSAPSSYHVCPRCKSMVEVRLAKCRKCGYLLSAASSRASAKLAEVVEKPAPRRKPIPLISTLAVLSLAVVCAFALIGWEFDVPLRGVNLSSEPFLNRAGLAPTLWEMSGRLFVGCSEDRVRLLLSEDPDRVQRPATYETAGPDYGVGDTWYFVTSDGALCIHFMQQVRIDARLDNCDVISPFKMLERDPGKGVIASILPVVLPVSVNHPPARSLGNLTHLDSLQDRDPPFSFPRTSSPFPL